MYGTEVIVLLWVMPVALNIGLPLLILCGWGLLQMKNIFRRDTVNQKVIVAQPA